jgi:hypothetical protein
MRLGWDFAKTTVANARHGCEINGNVPLLNEAFAIVATPMWLDHIQALLHTPSLQYRVA